MEITLLSLMALGATSAMGTLTVVLATLAFGCQLVRVSRRMHNYSNKLDQASRLLSSRRFPDELIGEMARVAHFDADVVQSEMNDVISPPSGNKGIEPYHGLNNTAPFGDHRNLKPSNDPNYQTLAGMNNLQEFEPDPTYQTLFGCDKDIFQNE